MTAHPIEEIIKKADDAINREDFDALIDIYADDAVLVIQPGTKAVGKAQIRKAFEAIAEYFDHSLHVRQAGMEILESNDTALVLANSIIAARDYPEEQRKATYVFKKDSRLGWLCVIDNSYGHELLTRNDG